jgi:hypothetical protein
MTKDHSPFLMSDGKHRKELSFDDPDKLLLKSLISFFGQLRVVASSRAIRSDDEPGWSQAQRNDCTDDHDCDEG